MKLILTFFCIFATISSANFAAMANEIQVNIQRIDENGIHEKLGSIILEQTSSGLKLSAKLQGFKVGKHAFHIHQNPNCAPGRQNGKMIPGLMAGNHYMRLSKNNLNTEHHHKPHGDLPELIADHQGKIEGSIIATHLSLAEVRNRSMIIHSHGESEHGKSSGGGKRIACGIIPK